MLNLIQDSTSITFSLATTTTYTITVSVAGFCPKSKTKIVTIVHAPDPIADFYITPEVALLLEPTFTFVNTSTGSTYKWYSQNNLFSTYAN